VGKFSPHRRVESPMNLAVTVAILPEYDLEKLQVIMQVPELCPYAPRWKAWHAYWMNGVEPELR
jgi:hypothetical protein